MSFGIYHTNLQTELFCTSAACPLLARGSFLALSTVGYAVGRCVHYRAWVGPGRALCRLLWAFEVAASWLFSRDRFRRARANQAHGNPQAAIFVFCARLLCTVLVFAASTTPALYRCMLWATVLQFISFVTGMNGASCVSVCATQGSYSKQCWN